MSECSALDLQERSDEGPSERMQASMTWSDPWPQNPEEFERLVEAFQDPLVRFAFRRLGDFHEAEDAIQEVFVKAYAGRARLRDVRNVPSYLYRMASNECADRQRRPRGRIVSIEDCHPDEMPSQEAEGANHLTAREEIERIERWLAGLPRRQAEAVRLRFLDGLSLADVAEALHCTVPTAKSRLRYGLQKLRRIVSRSKEDFQ